MTKLCIISAIIIGSLVSLSYGKLVNTGIVEVDLNSERETGLWTVAGNNGTGLCGVQKTYYTKIIINFPK
jgi:hypothetical protein